MPERNLGTVLFSANHCFVNEYVSRMFGQAFGYYCHGLFSHCFSEFLTNSCQIIFGLVIPLVERHMINLEKINKKVNKLSLNLNKAHYL